MNTQVEATQAAPGRHWRQGITLIELAEMFPTEQAAVEWFEAVIWADGRVCGHCGSDDTYAVKSGKPMPYRCRSCKHYFGVKTGSVMGESPLPVRKWVYAIYLDCTSLRGILAMALHRSIGVCYKTAWFMQQRIREAFAAEGPPVPFAGPVEVDETYVGGKASNMHAKVRREKITGRGGVDKTAVVGARDRATGQVAAEVIASVDGPTLRGFVDDHTTPETTVYTDGATAYRGRENHEAVHHSVGEYVRGQAHTNGVESFWAALKRGIEASFFHISPKHAQRYVDEFCWRHNVRDLDTIRQMQDLVARMVGRRLMWRDLIADPVPTFGAIPAADPF